MAEAITGDIAPADNVSKEEKHRLEEAAMAKVFRLHRITSDLFQTQPRALSS